MSSDTITIGEILRKLATYAIERDEALTHYAMLINKYETLVSDYEELRQKYEAIDSGHRDVPSTRQGVAGCH